MSVGNCPFKKLLNNAKIFNTYVNLQQEVYQEIDVEMDFPYFGG